MECALVGREDRNQEESGRCCKHHIRSEVVVEPLPLELLLFHVKSSNVYVTAHWQDTLWTLLMADPSAVVDPSKLWFIHGKAYDLTSFLDRHPGKLEESRAAITHFETLRPVYPRCLRRRGWVLWLFPGGSEVLKACQGTDCSELFETMHDAPMKKPRAILAKLSPVRA
jgi:hypothetical protein